MGFLKTLVVGCGLAFFLQLVYENLYTQHPVAVAGSADDLFKNVEKIFIDNFERGWESEGAALVVYHKGRKVVDLWGGFADKSSGRHWKEDTLTITFSTTKAVAALCIAKLVDRGRLKYDDLITSFWPAFGKHGKDNITVQMALSHMGGLAHFDQTITKESAADHNVMRQMIENEKPKWPPGTATGYHPYTYGWIVDQIIRHVDEKKRGVGQFMREEITTPNGIDYHIGLPLSESHRVARITVPTIWQRISEVYHDHRVIIYFKALYHLLWKDTHLCRAVNNPSWLQAVAKCTVNNPEYYKLEQAAALGIGNARSLAQIFNLVVSKNLLSDTLVNKLQHFHVNQTDLVFGDHVAKGHGFLYQPLNRASVPYFVGHSGHGCQQVVYDIKNQVVIAYVNNGLKTGLYHLCRTYYRLQNSIYDVIEEQSKH